MLILGSFFFNILNLLLIGGEKHFFHSSADLFNTYDASVMVSALSLFSVLWLLARVPLPLALPCHNLVRGYF